MYPTNTKCLYIVVHNIVGFMDQSGKVEESWTYNIGDWG